MEIEILQLIEGAKRAKGLAVIIDVFRAFSTACYVMERGAARIIPVGDMETAYRLKREHPDYVLMGERGGVVQPGFDYGNSPTQVRRADLAGRTVVHTTSAGTQGIVNAAHADEIITGSFVNAQAIVNYIKESNPRQVSLVCMGWNGTEPADEDTLCAEYLKRAIEGEANDFAAIMRYLREESRTGSFLDIRDAAHTASAPPEDFDRCLELDRCGFVLKAVRAADGLTELQKV